VDPHVEDHRFVISDFFHRAAAAFFAISRRCSAVNFFARLLPPLLPISRITREMSVFRILVA